MSGRPGSFGVAPPRVLVVEDDPETRRFYIGILEDDGFVVEQAHNGWQALDKACNTAPDLVLTDIAVPGLDGIGLCRLLKPLRPETLVAEARGLLPHVKP